MAAIVPSIRHLPIGDIVTVYVGGDFQSINGQQRYEIAAIDGAGDLTGWNPTALGGHVLALAVQQGVVYAGGDFSTIGGAQRSCIAALDATTGQATSWDPEMNREVDTITGDGTRLFAGGLFTAAGGVARTNVAALRRTDGTPTAWAPNVDGQIFSMAVDGSSVYVGGDFMNVGGVPHSHIAAIDPTTGDPTSWNPSTDGRVRSIATHAGSVYVGGSFNVVSDYSRMRLAAIDAMTGTPTSWNPGVNGDVYALAISQSSQAPFTVTTWIGGDFTSVAFQPRNHLAAVDGTTGALTGWDPNADADVSSLAVWVRHHVGLGDITTLYVGGKFAHVSGQPRSDIAAIDGGGVLDGWDPGANDQVEALAVDPSGVYAGGDFFMIGGQDRDGMAQIDFTGAVTAWDAGGMGWTLAIGLGNGVAYAGGNFNFAAGSPHGFIAGLSEGISTGVADLSPAASEAWVAAPNPFHGPLSLRFSLPAARTLDVAVFDLAGRRLRTLLRGDLAAGAHHLTWDGRTDDGRAAAPAVYFVRVRGGGINLCKRVLRVE